MRSLESNADVIAKNRIVITLFFVLFSEQKYFELEKELIETQGDLNVQSGLASELKRQLAELGKQFKSKQWLVEFCVGV